MTAPTTEDIQKKLKETRDDNLKLSKFLKTKIDENNNLNIAVNALKTDLASEKFTNTQLVAREKELLQEIAILKQPKGDIVVFSDYSQLKIKCIEFEAQVNYMTSDIELKESSIKSLQSSISSLQAEQSRLTKILEEKDRSIETSLNKLKQLEEKLSNTENDKLLSISKSEEKDGIIKSLKQKIEQLENDLMATKELPRLSVSGINFAGKEKEEVLRVYQKLKDMEQRVMANDKEREELKEKQEEELAKQKEFYEEKIERRNEAIHKLKERLQLYDEIKKKDIEEMREKFDNHAKGLIEKSEISLKLLEESFKKKLGFCQEEIASLKKIISERETEIMNLREKIVNTEFDFNKQINLLKGNLKGHFQSTMEDAIKSQEDIFESTKKEMIAENEKLRNKINNLTEKLNEIRADNQKLVESVKELFQKNEELQNQNSNLQEENIAMNFENEKLSSKLEMQIKEMNIKFQEDLHSHEGVIQNLKSSLDQERLSSINYKEIERAYHEMAEEIRQLKADNIALVKQIKALDSREQKKCIYAVYLKYGSPYPQNQTQSKNNHKQQQQCYN